MAERVEVRESVLKENDRIAGELRRALAGRGTLCLNLISSPGAGKTSILEGTLEALRRTPLRAAVLTGDIQTERDADRLKRYCFPALQITTGGTCHLDASMVQRPLESRLQSWWVCPPLAESPTPAAATPRPRSPKPTR